MIPSQELAEWLNDRQAQSQAARAVEETAVRIGRLPALERLRDELERSPADPARALALAAAFVASPGGVEEIVAALVAAARHAPYFRPHFNLALGDVHSGLMLLDRPGLSLALAVMSSDAIAAKRARRSGGASLIFTGRRAFFHFIKAGGAVLSFWEAPRIGAGFTADASGRCRPIERRRIEDGETVEMDGERFTFIVDEALHDLVFVQATTTLGPAPLAAEYDCGTMRFIGASSTDEAGSRIQMMLALLRAMDRRDAVPIFRQMLESGHFHARWQAMREFLALDAMAALPHLRSMAAGDPHPEVRQAAAQTLGRFFQEEMAECRW